MFLTIPRMVKGKKRRRGWSAFIRSFSFHGVGRRGEKGRGKKKPPTGGRGEEEGARGVDSSLVTARKREKEKNGRALEISLSSTFPPGRRGKEKGEATFKSPKETGSKGS